MEKTAQQVTTSVWYTFRLMFGIVPIVAGLDKFTNLLVSWPKYLAPVLVHVLPVSPPAFMHVVGIIEVVAGLGVLLSPWPRQFGYIVAAWLAGISLNLVMAGYFDVAVRDLVMAISAFSFARLGQIVPATVPERRSFRAPQAAH